MKESALVFGIFVTVAIIYSLGPAWVQQLLSVAAVAGIMGWAGFEIGKAR